MGLVVDADAEDFFRVGDGRKELQARKLLIRTRAQGRVAHLVECIVRERIAQRRVLVAQALVHCDHAVADNDAEGRLTVREIACELHALILTRYFL